MSDDASDDSSLLSLASQISTDAKLVDEYFKKNNIPTPSFSKDGPPAIRPIPDPAVAEAHNRLLWNSKQIHHLALGPKLSLSRLTDVEDSSILALIIHFQLAKHVPLEGEASMQSLAEISGIPISDLKYILRFAISNNIFGFGSKKDTIVHTAASRVLKEDPLTCALIELGHYERSPAAMKMVEAYEKHAGSEEPHLSAWGLANNATRPMFEELQATQPDRFHRFATAMDAMASLVSPKKAIEGFPWASLGKAKVVDVGGGKGPVSIAVAREFPYLTFVVQDMEKTIEEGKNQLPEDLNDRISFMKHDFFDPQPIEAEAYFFRAVFHNWPDKHCARILQSLTPALKRRARIFIEDPMTLPTEEVSPWQERRAVLGSLRMMQYFNSRDREPDDWKWLVQRADERFRVESIRPGLVELVWEGGE